jgi:hypothetical protein
MEYTASNQCDFAVETEERVEIWYSCHRLC